MKINTIVDASKLAIDPTLTAHSLLIFGGSTALPTNVVPKP